MMSKAWGVSQRERCESCRLCTYRLVCGITVYVERDMNRIDLPRLITRRREERSLALGLIKTTVFTISIVFTEMRCAESEIVLGTRMPISDRGP